MNFELLSCAYFRVAINVGCWLSKQQKDGGNIPHNITDLIHSGAFASQF